MISRMSPIFMTVFLLKLLSATDAFQFVSKTKECRQWNSFLTCRTTTIANNMDYNRMLTKNFPAQRQLSLKSLQMRSNGDVGGSSNIDFDEIEREAIAASESWGVAVTPFLNEIDSNKLKDRLNNRADVRYIEIGDIPISSVSGLDLENDSSSLSRTRTCFAMTNPDLELDANETEKEYFSMLRIDNLHTARIGEATTKSKPWPKLLMSIGVDLQNVGDIVIEEDTDCAFLMVSKKTVRQCVRLLPKELKGTGITITEMESGEYIPYDGVKQDMELGTIDKRALKYS